MINATSEVKNYIDKNARKFYARLLDESGNTVKGDIRSLSINKGSCSEYNFQPACVFSNYVNVTMDNFPSNVNITGKKLKVQIGCPLSSGTTWTTVATVYVANPSKKMGRIDFTGEGVISAKLGKKFPQTSASTLGDIINTIKTSQGVNITVEDSLMSGLLSKPVPSKAKLTDYYMRELVAFIAGCGFGYATETPNGDIVLRSYKYNDKTYSTSPSRMRSDPDFYDPIKPVGVQVSGTGETEFISGELQNCSLSNPLMTTDSFNAYKENFLGVQYQPYEMGMSLGNFLLEPSDKVKITDREGISHTLPCMNIQHKFDGGISTSISAPQCDNGEDYARGQNQMQSTNAYNSYMSGDFGGGIGGEIGSFHNVQTFSVSGDYINSDNSYLFVENGVHAYLTLHIDIPAGTEVLESYHNYTDTHSVVSVMKEIDNTVYTQMAIDFGGISKGSLSAVYDNYLKRQAFIPLFKSGGGYAGGLCVDFTFNPYDQYWEASYMYSTNYLVNEFGSPVATDSKTFETTSVFDTSFCVQIDWLLQDAVSKTI